MKPILFAIFQYDLERPITILIFTIPVVFLSLFKRISDLQWISYISLSSIMVFIIFVIVGFAAGLTSKERVGKIEYFLFQPQMFSVLGTITVNIYF
jgi:amino acid permease